MDTHIFQQQIIKLSDPLFRFALWRLGQREEAEDVVQDTFMRMWEMKGKLSGYERLDYLAFRILRNLCIDRARKRKLSVKSWPDNFDKACPMISPQRKIELTEALAAVEKAARALPEQQKTILFLRNVEGYSTKEVAEMLELKVNTVEVKLSRARKSIRKILKK